MGLPVQVSPANPTAVRSDAQECQLLAVALGTGNRPASENEEKKSHFSRRKVSEMDNLGTFESSYLVVGLKFQGQDRSRNLKDSFVDGRPRNRVGEGAKSMDFASGTRGGATCGWRMELA